MPARKASAGCQWPVDATAKEMAAIVGDQKVLVHDNNIRDVTPALVPGWIAK